MYGIKVETGLEDIMSDGNPEEEDTPTVVSFVFLCFVLVLASLISTSYTALFFPRVLVSKANKAFCHPE